MLLPISVRSGILECPGIALSPLLHSLCAHLGAGQNPSRRINLHLETRGDANGLRHQGHVVFMTLAAAHRDNLRLLISEPCQEAAGQQENSGISSANHWATILPAYTINPKSHAADEGALFWWHADVSLVTFHLDIWWFQSHVDQLGRLKHDNYL